MGERAGEGALSGEMSATLTVSIQQKNEFGLLFGLTNNYLYCMNSQRNVCSIK